MKRPNVAVIGVGAVGVEMLRVLRQRKFPIGKLKVFARSERDIHVDNIKYHVFKIDKSAFRGIDIALFAGTSPEEFETTSSTLKVVYYRLPWLLFGIFGSLIAAKLITLFDHFPGKALLLASLAPLIMTASGNIGAQTSMINARELSQDDMGVLFKTLLKKEIVLALIIAVIVSILSGITSYFLYFDQQLSISLLIGTLFSIITSSTLGVIIPYLFKILNIDPALATGPLMTPLCDVVALTSFFVGAYLIFNVM